MTVNTDRNVSNTFSRRQAVKMASASAAGLALAGRTGVASASGKRSASSRLKAQDRTTITFSATGDANVEQPVFKDLIEMFNESQGSIFVEYQPFPEGGYEKAVAMLQAGTTPDIMRIDDDTAYFIATSGKAHDLTPYIQELSAEDYYPFLFHELAADGKLFAVPMCDSVWSWIYNKTLFEEAGLQAPQTWADAWDWDTAVENYRALAKVSDDFTEVYAGEVGHGEEMPYQAGVGHYNHNMTQANFDHPLNVEMMRLTAQLQYEEKICLPPGGGDRLDLFNASQLASMNQVQSNAISISPDIDWDFAPQNKAKCYAFSAQFSRAFILPVDGPAQNADAAWEFFNWYLTSPDAQMRVMEGAWGVPPLRSAATAEALASTSWGEGKTTGVLVEGLDYAYPRVGTPFTDAMAKNWKSGDERDDVMLGQTPPEEFCERAQQLVQEAMDEAIAAGWSYTPPPKPEIESNWTRWYYEGDVSDADPRLACGLAKDDPAV